MTVLGWQGVIIFPEAACGPTPSPVAGGRPRGPGAFSGTGCPSSPLAEWGT